MSTTPAIDLEHLRRYSGGDQDLEAEVFAMFRQQVEMWMRLLEPDTDTESWASAVHSLKGSARSIGAHDLATTCETAEQANANGPTARAIAIGDMRNSVDAALNFIDSHTYKTRLQALRKASQCENS